MVTHGPTPTQLLLVRSYLLGRLAAPVSLRPHVWAGMELMTALAVAERASNKQQSPAATSNIMPAPRICIMTAAINIWGQSNLLMYLHGP
jgi:hypothetical protein